MGYLPAQESYPGLGKWVGDPTQALRVGDPTAGPPEGLGGHIMIEYFTSPIKHWYNFPIGIRSKGPLW